MSKDLVLVTGAAGLIGTWVTRRLQQHGYDVAVTDVAAAMTALPAAKLQVAADLSDPGAVRDVFRQCGPVSHVVHCAGMLQFSCETNPRAAVDVNVGATTSLLDTARACGARRLVLLSTSALYGSQVGLLDEHALVGAPHGLLGVYPATKWLAERVGLAGQRAGSGVDFVALRLGFVFGLGQPRSAGLSDVIQRIYGGVVRGRPFEAAEVGGNESWHFVHVLDVCEAIVAALKCPPGVGGVFNLGGPSGMYMSLNRFIGEVARVAGQAPQGRLSGRADAGPELDTRALVEQIGYRPAFDLANAVAHDVAWLAEQGAAAR